MAAAFVGLVVVATSLAAACDQSAGLKRQNNAADGTPEAGREAPSGMTDVDKLRDGDCIAGDIGFFKRSFARVDVVPCSSAEATYRVSRMFTVGIDGDPYPGDAYVEKQAQKCADAALFPTEDVWDRGGRTVICFADR